MKLIAALLLTAVHAKLAPVHLAKKSGVKAVQAIDLGGGKKASGGYGQWAKDNAAANGIIIGAFKTAAADLMAQVSDSESDFDLKRNLLFFAFGGAYLGAFQYWYQVNIFKRIFTATERFTSQSLEKKLKDTEGLIQLAMQIALNLTILSCVYLPTFYLFKAVFFGDCGLASCFGESWGTYTDGRERSRTVTEVLGPRGPPASRYLVMPHPDPPRRKLLLDDL
ncbi:unnamed protein product, partial [Pelagomonas calceolata]